MNKRIIALGFFDGVHLGHGALLKYASKLSKRLSVSSAALTFTAHPSSILSGGRLPLINTTAERVRLIRELYHIDEVLLCNFNSDFAHLGCDEFVRTVLVDKYRAAHIVAGYDYKFGYNACGDTTELKRLCDKYGLGFSEIQKVELDGITVSSTYIRKLISEGDMKSAADFLGHPHCMEGVVQPGKKLGRTLGLPTINLKFEDGIIVPRRGVYISRVLFDGDFYRGVTNIGERPTVTDTGTVNAETHIIGFNRDIYEKHVRIEFFEFLREEIRFSSVDELKEQIKLDIVESNRR